MKRLSLRRIVCPMDLSGEFRSSLSYALAMARARDAEVRALHVVPSEGAAAPERVSSSEHHRLMQRLRESLTDADPGYDRIGAAVRTGDPGTQIVQYAQAMLADLVVVGAPGLDRPKRPVGPVASVVIARSDCAVLAVPAHATVEGGVAGVFSRILCAIDPTPSSATVIRQALSLAWETGGRLTYVCVLAQDTEASASQTKDTLVAAIPSEARGWCEMDVLLAKGTPGVEVVRLADEQRCDLVVIGAPRRWTSTTHAVLGRSLCPVLVTHASRPLPWPSTRLPDDSNALTGSVDALRKT